MKKIFINFTLLISSFYFSQITTTNISFDNYVTVENNDLKNHFVSTLYYNLLNNGNNYYVSTPLQGNVTQPLTFCKKYQGVESETMKISIDFKKDKYPTPAGNYVGAGIFIADDSNLTVLSTYFGSSLQFFIGGLTNPNNPYPTTIDHNKFIDLNWYRLTLEITKTGISKFLVNSKIYGLGTNGTSNPILIATNSSEGLNYKFKSTSQFRINLVGGYWDDVRYFDNFSVYGFENGTNCTNLSVSESKENKILVFPNPTDKNLFLDSKVDKIEIYNLNGQKIVSINNPISKIDISKLEKGNYVLKIFANNIITTEKIVKR